MSEERRTFAEVLDVTGQELAVALLSPDAHSGLYSAVFIEARERASGCREIVMIDQRGSVRRTSATETNVAVPGMWVHVANNTPDKIVVGAQLGVQPYVWVAAKIVAVLVDDAERTVDLGRVEREWNGGFAYDSTVHEFYSGLDG